MTRFRHVSISRQPGRARSRRSRICTLTTVFWLGVGLHAWWSKSTFFVFTQLFMLFKKKKVVGCDCHWSTRVRGIREYCVASLYLVFTIRSHNQPGVMRPVDYISTPTPEITLAEARAAALASYIPGIIYIIINNNNSMRQM